MLRPSDHATKYFGLHFPQTTQFPSFVYLLGHGSQPPSCALEFRETDEIGTGIYGVLLSRDNITFKLFVSERFLFPDYFIVMVNDRRFIFE